jgi:hypothetical protein
MRKSGGEYSREGSVFAPIEKLERARKMKRIVLPVLVLVWALVLTSPGVSVAVVGVVRDGRIEDVPGVRFENILYAWNSLSIDVVNMTNRSMTFGGTMTFLDRRGRPVARVRLLPKKILRDSVERYKGYFVEGTGETARRASRILWDFGPR